MSLVTLPEELLLSVLHCLKDAHDETCPRTSPISHTIRSTMYHSAIDALSLTCRTLRRIALPMLFESVGIILPYRSAHYRMDEEMACLKANAPLSHLVRFMHIKTDKYMQGIYKYFVLQVLKQCPRLERITIPWYVLCTDSTGEILHAIEDHPTLHTALCSNATASLKDAFPRPGPMTKVKLQSITLRGPQDLSAYPTFLERQLSVRELRLTWIFDFAQLAQRKFRGLEKLSLTDVIPYSDLSSLDNFLDLHSDTLISVNVKHKGPAQHVLKHMDPSLHALMQTLDMKVRTVWLEKTDGYWLVKDMEAEMRISREDSTCQGLSDAINALGVRMPAIEKFRLGVTFKSTDQDDGEAREAQPLRPLKDFAADAFSTYSNLQYLTLRAPEELLGLPKREASICDMRLRRFKPTNGRRYSEIAEPAFLETAHNVAMAAEKVDMITFEVVEPSLLLMINGGAQQTHERIDLFRALVDREAEPKRVYKGEMARVKGKEDTTYYEYVGDGWPAVTEDK